MEERISVTIKKKISDKENKSDLTKKIDKSKVRTNVPTGNVASPMSSKGEPLILNLYTPCFYQNNTS